MIERTITKEQLIDILEDAILHHTTTDFILEKVFPPMFKPKEEEVICTSDTEDFKDHSFNSFGHFDSIGMYVCNSCSGQLLPRKYARPLTPTQKGE
jgi:hypothetical protein